mgnify:CR=1 FL=1
MVKPLSLIIPKLRRISGNESKNLPPNANTAAKSNDKIKIENLTILLNFFVEAFAINLNNK